MFWGIAKGYLLKISSWFYSRCVNTGGFKKKKEHEIEKWRDIPGYEGKYQASNFGRVRSLDFMIGRGKGKMLWKGRVKKPTVATNGYKVMNLGLNDVNTVHSLVAMAFFGSIPETVNHKDGNKLNNRLPNLELATYQRNNIHAMEIGLRKVRITPEIAREIKSMVAAGSTKTAAARKFKVTIGAITNVINNKLWFLRAA